jgi:small-conductance mechanosensitive channel
MDKMACLRRLLVLFSLTALGWTASPLPVLAQDTPAESAASSSRFFAERVAKTREHVRLVVQALPELPRSLEQAAASFRNAAGDRGVPRILLGMALCLIAGAAVEWLFRLATSGLRSRRDAIEVRKVNDRLVKFGIDVVVTLGSVVAFAIGALVVLLEEAWPGALPEVGIAFLVAVLWLRLALALLSLLLRPRARHDRHMAAFDVKPEIARFWHVHVATFVGWFAFGWATIASLRALGMPRSGLLLLAYLLGLGLLAIALRIVWRARPAAADGSAASSRAAGNAGRWLASAAAVAFWLVWAIGAMPVFWFLVAAVGLPLTISAARRGARHLLRPVESTDGSVGAPSVVAVLAEQGLRAALIVGAIWMLLWGWGLDFGSLAAQENATARLVRGALHALIILLMADLVWNLVKALADNTLARAQAAADLDPEEARRRARIRTLLPIGRNLAFIVLLVMAALMALAALGVEIGPLVASAGVVGVAVGFGAQTVVRDIISGMFYMIDDAFRVGEYIQSGSYKGTVESFSLRSVKLRHQRGALFTIPFGVLGAVQNMSRDWVIVKDVIGITYDSDPDLAKKLIKQVGLELAKDPDLAPNILQPLKMQGVEEFGDYAIKIRTKMMTKPGEQFVIRRRANAMIKKAFDANGVKFAFPTVQLAGGGDANGTAVAAAAQQVLQPTEKSAA